MIKPGSQIICQRVSNSTDNFGVKHPIKYQQCTPLSFRQYWAGENAFPKESGVAYIACSKEGLCYYALLDDQNIFSQATENQQRLWELGDVVEFFIKPGIDQEKYWEIHVSPNDLFMDMYIPNREDARSGKIPWEYLAEAQSNCTKRVEIYKERNQWAVEVCVPWQTFNLSTFPQPGTQWQIALCRYNYSSDLNNPELSSTALLTQIDFHRYEEFHILIWE